MVHKKFTFHESEVRRWERRRARAAVTPREAPVRPSSSSPSPPPPQPRGGRGRGSRSPQTGRPEGPCSRSGLSAQRRVAGTELRASPSTPACRGRWNQLFNFYSASIKRPPSCRVSPWNTLGGDVHLNPPASGVCRTSGEAEETHGPDTSAPVPHPSAKTDTKVYSFSQNDFPEKLLVGAGGEGAQLTLLQTYKQNQSKTTKRSANPNSKHKAEVRALPGNPKAEQVQKQLILKSPRIAPQE